MRTQNLKIGFLIDSINIPAWIYSAIQYLANERSNEFALVILNEDSGDSNKNSLSTKAYSLLNRIDEKLFTKEPDPFALKNAGVLFSKTPIIKTYPVKKNNAWFLQESTINCIQNYQLDILIKFGFECLQLDDIKVSKYGTWHYYHGDDRLLRGGPPGFWEVVENWPETSCALLATGGKFSPIRVLFRSSFVTYPLSPARHRSYYFWATTPFLSRQIESLRRLGEEKYHQETEKFNPIPLGEIKRYKVPSNLLALSSFSKIVLRLIKLSIQRVFIFNQWFLMFSLKKDVSDGLAEFIRLRPSKDKFWADPHVIFVNKKFYIFIEEFLRTNKKGHISVIEMDQLGNWKTPIKVLEKDFHLSYPFVFEWKSKFFMVPESRENKTIDLYESVDFPNKWIFKQSLMQNISAVDTTLVYYLNKWWLFTALAENEAAAPNIELFLFFADDLFSDGWQAHPQNPIISDIKKARPGGSLFVKNGKLYRPSQDCSKAYGYGFDLNEIEIISETEYREKRILSIRPDRDNRLLATHTYANCGNLTVIDGLKKIIKFF